MESLLIKNVKTIAASEIEYFTTHIVRDFGQLMYF